MTLDPNNPLHLIPATLAANPDAVAVIPVFAPATPGATLVLRAQVKLRRLPPELAARIVAEDATAGGNGTRPEVPTHMEVGRVLLTIPSDMAENLQGPVADRHPLYLITVHRSIYDAAMRQAQSGIVLPGVVPAPAAGGRIVKP